jgi:hypothetical protein
VKDKLATLLIAIVGAAVGVLGVGAITDADADSPTATSQQPVVVHVESPSTAAGGDSFVKLSDVDALCQLGAATESGGGGGGASGGSQAQAAATVASSGNSANTNTNAVAVNNQIGLEQHTVVVQGDDNASQADPTQAETQAQSSDQTQPPVPDQPPADASTPQSTPTTTTTTTTMPLQQFLTTLFGDVGVGN